MAFICMMFHLMAHIVRGKLGITFSFLLIHLEGNAAVWFNALQQSANVFFKISIKNKLKKKSEPAATHRRVRQNIGQHSCIFEYAAEKNPAVFSP